MKPRYLITPLLLSSQIIGITAATFLNELGILIFFSGLSSLFIFLNYKIFRDDIEVFGSFVVLFTAVLVAIYNNYFVLITSWPLVYFLLVIIARQLYIMMYNKEPETGKYLFWQRDRIYTLILFNILFLLMFLFLFQPWAVGRERTIWLLIIFAALQLPLLLIGWLIKWYLNKKRKNRRKNSDLKV